MIITSLGTRPQSIAFIEEFIQMTGESVYSLALDRRMDVKNIVYKEKYKTLLSCLFSPKLFAIVRRVFAIYVCH